MLALNAMSKKGTNVNQARLDVPLIISEWLQPILVDPLSKMRFVNQSHKGFESPCGLQYGYTDGVPDFRVRFAGSAEEWLVGQLAFESWLDKYFDRGEAEGDFYRTEQAIDSPIYAKFALSGRVLDVGGQLGHIRKYLQPDQEYCSLDPFVGVHVRARNRPNLFASYPLAVPLNFVGGYAEFLPFQEGSFDVVNMRSCIDHFFNPEIALLETFRVLRKGGRLIVGLTVEGRSLKSKIKECIRPAISPILTRYKDHHMWHPSYDNLIKLCDGCGFDLCDEIWQTADIFYGSFSRRTSHLVAADSFLKK
jgi:SAM-dependent methyltransferase